jgi:MFS family permease
MPADQISKSHKPFRNFLASFASLRFFNYRLWWGGTLISNIGTWLQRTGQDWLVMAVITGGKANSGLYGGIVTALQFIPILFLSVYAGLISDRVDRRKMLMITQTLQGLLAFGLGAIVLSGHVTIWIVFIFAFALGIVNAFDSPVRQTFVGEMVPTTSISNAIGLNSMAFNIARLIGPAVAGLLIAWIGTGWMFILNGISFAATTISLFCMHKNELHQLPHARKSTVVDSSGHRQGGVREGLSYVRHRPDLVIIIILAAVVSCLGMNTQLTQAQMAIRVFHKGSAQYGLLGTTFAIGAIAGTLMTARFAHPRLKHVVGAALAFGVFLGTYCVMPTYLSFALVGILVGFASLTFTTSANSAVQMSTPPQMRGRTMAIYLMFFQGVTPIGALLVGWIAEWAGPRWSIGVGAIACLAVGLWALIYTLKHRHLHIDINMHTFPPQIYTVPTVIDTDTDINAGAGANTTATTL